MTDPSINRHPASADPHDLLQACTVQHTRGRGPGGQHRNKVQTAIRLVHRPTGIRAGASERRSQEQNLHVALRRLRLNLAVETRQPIGDPFTPTDLWQSRCRNRKISVNPDHTDFPAVLAEALDVVTAQSYDIKKSAGLLHVSSSQLIHLLKAESRAMAWVNARRVDHGMHPLK